MTYIDTTVLAGRRVLVTGASGFIGSHVVRRLLADGALVSAVSSSVSAITPARLDDVADRIDIVEANLDHRSSLEQAVRATRPELVLHLAAFTHVGKSFHRVEQTVQTNIQGTVNLLEVLGGAYERLVYVGTSDVYGDAPVPFLEDGPVSPVSPYAVSKYAAERYCRMFHQANGWPIVCLRPFNTYGPWQSADRVIPEIVLAGLLRKPLRMTEGRQTREFTFVEDVADAFVRALVAPGIEGEVFNVGRGDEVSMRDLALTVLELLGNPIQPEFGALDYRPTEIWRMFGDSSKARRVLGWTPSHSLGDGLAKTIDWYRDQVDRRSRFLGG